MRVLRVLPAADRDIDDAAGFYAEQAGIDTALRFLSAVQDAQARLVEHPLIGPAVSSFHPRLAPMRFWPVPGFESHLLFYVVTPHALEVVRVLHGARDLTRYLGPDAGSGGVLE